MAASPAARAARHIAAEQAQPDGQSFIRLMGLGTLQACLESDDES
jgi:hypothetical protein